ncbi:MAG: hypothetical protein H0X13_15510 [Ramlibacter sp.]|nr:hypothetical protein [Ramlibacter sp.]
MTSADQAAAGMKASMAINHAQQELTEESRVLLTSIVASVVRDEMRIAVAEGISAALTDEAAERFWAKGLEVLQRQATVKTGRFILDGVSTLAKKLFWVGLIVLAIYSVGGWAAIKVAWAAINKG